MIADIFIPTNNNVQALSNCLESLKNQSSKNFEIYIIASEKNSTVENLIRKFNSLKITYRIQTQKGLVGAANMAFKLSRNDVFIRIDDDVELDKGWFSSIIKTFESDKKIGGVTGPTVMSEKGRLSRDVIYFLTNFKSPTNIVSRLLKYIYHDYLYEGRAEDVGKFLKSGVFTIGSNLPQCLELKRPIEVDNLEACNFACKKNLLEKYNGFDTLFENGLSEYHEADLSFKIIESGFKILFNPQVKLFHRVEISKNRSRPDAFYRIFNFIVFYKRHIKADNIDKFFRFITNILLQDAYYIFKFLSTGDWTQLGAIAGTVYGLFYKAN